MSQKVFVIGFPKTGTMSLGRALKALGYRMCHHLKVGGSLKIDGPMTREKIADACLPFADDYDGFRNFPWSVIYRELDERIPEAKFILTVRQPEPWMESMLGHFGDKALPVSEPLCGRMLAPKGNEEAFHELYREHNAAVADHFKGRPDKCLVMDIEEADWPPLCAFLGRRKPLFRGFPHRNRGDLRRKDASHIEKVLRYNFGEMIRR